MKKQGTFAYSSSRQMFNEYFYNSSDEEDEEPEEDDENEDKIELNGEDFKYDCDEDHEENIGNSERQFQKVIQLKNSTLGISASGQNGHFLVSPHQEQAIPHFSSRSANENQSCNNSQMSLQNPQHDLTNQSSLPQMGSLEKLHGEKKSSMRSIRHNVQEEGERELEENRSKLEKDKFMIDQVSSEQIVSWRENYSGRNKYNVNKDNSEEKPTGDNNNSHLKQQNQKDLGRKSATTNQKNGILEIILKKQLIRDEENNINGNLMKKDQTSQTIYSKGQQKIVAVDAGGKQFSKILKNSVQILSSTQQKVIKSELLVNWIAQILLGISLFVELFHKNNFENTYKTWELLRASLLIVIGLAQPFLSFISILRNEQLASDITRPSYSYGNQTINSLPSIQFPCTFHPKWIKQILIFMSGISFVLILEQTSPDPGTIQIFFAFIQLLVIHKLAASVYICTFLSFLFPGILMTYALLRQIKTREIEFIVIEVILYLSIIFGFYKMRLFALSPFLFGGILHRSQQVVLLNAGVANSLSTGSCVEDLNVSCKRISRVKSTNTVPDGQNQHEKIHDNDTPSPVENQRDLNKRIKKVYQDILNVIPEGVALINSSNKLVYANKTLQNILSCQKNQIVATLMGLATKPQNQDNKSTHKATSLPQQYQQQYSQGPQLRSFHSLNYPISSYNNSNAYFNNNNEDFQSLKQHVSSAAFNQPPGNLVNGMNFNTNSNSNNLTSLNNPNGSINNSQQMQFSINSPQSLTKLIDPPNSTPNQNDLKGGKSGSKPSLFHRNQRSSFTNEEGDMLIKVMEEQQQQIQATINKNIQKRFSLPLNDNFKGFELDLLKKNNINNTTKFTHEGKKTLTQKLSNEDEEEVEEQDESVEKQNPSANNGNNQNNNNGSSHNILQLNTVNPQTIASKRTNEFSDMISLSNYIQNYNIGNGIHYQNNNNYLKDNNNNNINTNNNFNINDSAFLNDQGKSLNLGQRLEEEFDFVRQRRSKKFKNTEITRKDINVKEILNSIFENNRQVQQDQDTKTAKTFKFSKDQTEMPLNFTSATKLKINTHQQSSQIQHSHSLQPGQQNYPTIQHQQSLSHHQATQPPQRQGSFLTQMKNQNNIGCFQQIDDMIKVEVEYRNSTLVLSMVMCEIVTNGFAEQLALILVDPIWQEMYDKKVQDMHNYRMKMFASLSHELRTPLNCSISMLQQLKNILSDSFKQAAKEGTTPAVLSIKERIQAKLNQKNSEIKTHNDNNNQKSSKEQEEKTKGYITEYIDPALNSNNLLLNLINDILDFVQIDSGKFKFTFVKFDLEQLLSNCVSMVGIQSKQNSRNVELSLKYDEKCPKIINSDPNRIRQVVLNFLSNSLKFTPVGQITLSATLVNSKDRSQHFSIQDLHHLNNFELEDDQEQNKTTQQDIIEIAVEDQGIGISQEDIDKIFTIFNKVNLGEAQALNSQGCGLGLTISNSIAKGLGPFNKGGVRVHSQKGQGSIFSIFVEDKQPELQQEQKLTNSKEEMALIKKMATINSYAGTPKSQQTCNFESPLPYSPVVALEMEYSQQPTLHYLGLPQAIKSEESQQVVLTQSNMTNKTTKSCKTGKSIKGVISCDSCCVLDTEHNQQQIQHISLGIPFEIRNQGIFDSPSPSKQDSDDEQDDEENEEELENTGKDDNNDQNKGKKSLDRLQDFLTASNTAVGHNKKPFYNSSSKNAHITYNTKSFHKIKTEQKDNANADAYISYNSIRSLKRIQHSPTQVSLKKIKLSSSNEQQYFLSPSPNEQLPKQSASPRQYLSKSSTLHKKSASEPIDNQNSISTGLQQYKLVQTTLEFQNLLGSSEKDNPIILLQQQEGNSQVSKKNEDQNESSSQISNKLNTSLDLKAPPPPSEKCECPQVLVVDDNHFNIYAIAMQLKTYGFKVDQGFNGQEAVDMVKKRFFQNNCCKIYQLIFMDIEMPVKNGYSAAEEIREFYKDEQYTGKQPIIIACTAYVSDEDNQKAINHGMDDFIKKPVFQEGLEQLFEEWYSEIFEDDDNSNQNNNSNNKHSPRHHHQLHHNSQDSGQKEE